MISKKEKEPHAIQKKIELTAIATVCLPAKSMIGSKNAYQPVTWMTPKKVHRRITLITYAKGLRDLWETKFNKILCSFGP